MRFIRNELLPLEEKNSLTSPILTSWDLGPIRPARDLLLQEAPRLRGEHLRMEHESIYDAAIRIANVLREGVLPIQGPPGARKTFTGARMICALVRKGRTVGITANSHKVVRNLIDEVLKASDAMDIDLTCLQ
jgi:uncharacterized protein